VSRDVIEKLFEKYERDLQDEAAALDAIRVVLKGEASALKDGHRAALEAHLRRFDYVNDTWGAPFSIPQSVREKAYKVGKMVRGEDIMFTDRVHRDLGIKIYCDLEVHCTHNKVMGLLWPADARREMSVDEWRPSVYSPVVGQ
jgi:hypothetical protein